MHWHVTCMTTWNCLTCRYLLVFPIFEGSAEQKTMLQWDTAEHTFSPFPSTHLHCPSYTYNQVLTHNWTWTPSRQPSPAQPFYSSSFFTSSSPTSSSYLKIICWIYCLPLTKCQCTVHLLQTSIDHSMEWCCEEGMVSSSYSSLASPLIYSKTTPTKGQPVMSISRYEQNLTLMNLRYRTSFQHTTTISSWQSFRW